MHLKTAGLLFQLTLLLAVGLAPSARAQCAGDCDGDGSVSVSELIRGVNINLGMQSVDACPAFDTNDDGMVAVNELIQGVNANLNGCPPVTVTPATNTPTPTATEPPSGDCGNETIDDGEECDDGKHCVRGDNLGDACSEDSDCGGDNALCETRNGDGCQADCLLAACGDEIADIAPGTCEANVCVGPNSFAGEACSVDSDCLGETCDDGNTTEGFDDRCPSNCRIAQCVPTGQTLTVNVDFAASAPDTFAAGLELFVRYADGVVSIPGSSDAQSVRARIESPGGVFPSITPNDRDYGLVLVLLDPSLFGAEPGTAVTVELDLCEGAPAPTAGDFECTVNSASDESLNDITDLISCDITL